MSAPTTGRNERVTLLVATLASFLTPFMGSATNVALPSIGEKLGVDAVGLSWLATAYLLSAAVFLVPFGRIADVHGRRRVFVGGLVVHTLASLLCALAPSFSALLAGRVVQGVGGGMIFGTGVALLTSVFPRDRRGRALGWNVAAVYLGLSMGPPIGGVLTQQLGWRSVFAAGAGLGLVATVAAARGLVGEWADARGETLDLPGAAFYGIGLATTMYGLALLPDPDGAALVALGLCTLAAFATWERRAPHPLLDVGLFLGNRVFALSNLAALISYAATFAVSFLLSLYLQSVGGQSAQGAGAVLAAQPLVQTAVSPFAGRLSDRVQPRVVASFGMGLTAVALALLALLDEGRSLVPVLGCLALLGAGFGMFSAPNTNAVMGSVSERSYGIAAATLATMRLVGQMLSMGLAGLLLALFVGREPLTPACHADFLTAMRTAFSLFALLCLGATLASLARGRLGAGATPRDQ